MQGTKYEQEEQKQFLAFLSPSFKEKVAICVFRKQLMRNKRMKEFFDDLVSKKVKLAEAGEQGALFHSQADALSA